MQLTADIFGLPTTKPHTYETSGLGAAMDAAVGLKLHPDFTAAVKEMTHLAMPMSQSRKITRYMMSSTNVCTARCTTACNHFMTRSATSLGIRRETGKSRDL
jgi:ribulose kinase